MHILAANSTDRISLPPELIHEIAAFTIVEHLESTLGIEPSFWPTRLETLAVWDPFRVLLHLNSMWRAVSLCHMSTIFEIPCEEDGRLTVWVHSIR